MERVYLLLRNNQQTGPFAIGELLQQQLRSSDMIWIEGKSTAWTYLSELELIPFIKLPEASGQKNEVKGKDEIERKAEELRQKILAAAPKTYLPNHVAEIETYASPYNLPEDEIEFVDYRKVRKIKNSAVLGELVLTCFVIGLFVLGIYKGKSFLGVRDKAPDSVATQLTSGDQHAAQKNKPVTSAPLNISVIDTVKKQDSLLAIHTVKSKISVSPRTRLDTTATSVSQPVVTTKREEQKETTLSSNVPIEENAIKKDGLVKKDIVPAIEAKKDEPVKEEKKGFLKGLFKKKKKDDKTENKGN